jgi:uncharacterized membrane protein required for colicin V production
MEQARQLLSEMHAVDFVIGLVVATYAVRGYGRGLLGEVLSLAALLCALAAAFRWTPTAVDRFGASIPGAAFTDTGIAFLVVFGLTGMGLRVFVSAAERMSGPAAASPLNRLGGAMFGVCKGGVVLGCTVLALRALSPTTTLDGAPQANAGGGPVQALTSRLASAPLASHVTQWTGDFLKAFGSAAETRIRMFAASPEAP